MTTFIQNKYRCIKCGIIWSGSFHQDYCVTCTQTKVLKDELRSSNQNNGSGFWDNLQTSLKEKDLQKQLEDTQNQLRLIQERENSRQRAIDRAEREAEAKIQREKEEEERNRLLEIEDREVEQYTEEDAFNEGKNYFINHVDKDFSYRYTKDVGFLESDDNPNYFLNKNLNKYWAHGVLKFLDENISLEYEDRYKEDLYNNVYSTLKTFLEHSEYNYSFKSNQSDITVEMSGGAYFGTENDDALNISIDSDVQLNIDFSFSARTGKYSINNYSTVYLISSYDYDHIVDSAIAKVLKDINSRSKCSTRVKRIRSEKSKQFFSDYGWWILILVVFSLLLGGLYIWGG